MGELSRVGIWAGCFDAMPAAAIRDAAKAVEAAGYATLWFPETTGREAMSQAALLLSATRNLLIGTGIASIYARDAVTSAAARRTLDEAFPGRFRLGLGVSHPSLVEDVRGHRFGSPAATMGDYLTAMAAAPYGPASSVLGPPLIAALGPAMLKLAAERGCGALPLGMPVEHTRRARAILGPDAPLVVIQNVVLTSDDESGRLARAATIAAWPNRRPLLADYGFTDLDAVGEDVVEALVARGTPEDIAARVDEHLRAGADQVGLNVITASPDRAPLQQWSDVAVALANYPAGAR